MELGIYEQIINQLFRIKLEKVDTQRYYIGKEPITKDNAAALLSQYLFSLFKLCFAGLEDDEAVDKGIKLANDIIRHLAQQFSLEGSELNLIDKQKEILTAVIDRAECGYPDIAAYLKEIVPVTRLSHSSLFTGSGITLESELRREIMTADEICLLVSFIKDSGLNQLIDQLRQVTEHGKRLRVITSTYMQATDYKAVRRLAQLKNTEVKISYDSEADRLHAKSYIFLRNTGFHTAYIGSSNMSKAALENGLEWNLKVTQVEMPEVLRQITNSFDGYWHNENFELFRPGIDDERLKQALNKTEGTPIDYDVLDLMKAKDYQEDILERLRVEREVHHHYKNLVVAATGTGKTVISAFDFKRFRQSHDRARLLFVAHRQEILEQSLKTFRRVLNDYNFGDVWYSGHTPESYEALFASKDIMDSHLDELQLADDYYDYIVIDEVHHVAAKSYRRIMEKFRPTILLGLTATPERMDGQDITQDFDGHISAEIRLDTALNNRLLCPFHYYGVTDSTDLRQVKWSHGHYDIAELSKVYTHNDARTAVIFHALENYLDDVHHVKALCFCVDKQHADYMAAKFTLAGLKADKLTSDNAEERTRLSRKLRKGEINYLFVVDMFNEGVDIPEIDTVLFLRPTESLTIFLQQLGRGLRKAKGKSHVDVLDFVGQCNKEFDYTDRFRAILGRTSMSVAEELQHDFPHLPLGCQVKLEPKAKEYILNNINQNIRNFSFRSLQKMVDEWDRKFSLPLSLANFINMYRVPLERLYNKHTFSELTHKHILHGEQLAKAVRNKWLSTDCHSYFSFIKTMADLHFQFSVEQLSVVKQRQLLMLYYDLYQQAGAFDDLQKMANELSKDTAFCEELSEVMSLLMARCTTLEMDDNSGLPDFPLRLHARYTRDQIRVALGTSTLERMSSAREGVERNKALNVEAMYVDIIKDREEGSNTNYDDHAISASEFLWDTQNKVSPQSPTGQNYIHSRQTMLLFVREQSNFADDKSRTMGYVYLGKAQIVDYKYNVVSYGRQMQIRWHMLEPMPASVYQFAKYQSAI
jgi:superfamily II DNA or RNA helicase/HKD family nuclease